jgi:Na+-driven multidrug efflux pump
MNFTYKQIWLINFPVMMSLLMEQLINLTDTVFLGHVGEIELGASWQECITSLFICLASASA